MQENKPTKKQNTTLDLGGLLHRIDEHVGQSVKNTEEIEDLRTRINKTNILLEVFISNLNMEFITIEQVSRITNITQKKIRYHCLNGYLKDLSIRDGRHWLIRRCDVIDLVKYLQKIHKKEEK